MQEAKVNIAGYFAHVGVRTFSRVKCLLGCFWSVLFIRSVKADGAPAALSPSTVSAPGGLSRMHSHESLLEGGVHRRGSEKKVTGSGFCIKVGAHRHVIYGTKIDKIVERL